MFLLRNEQKALSTMDYRSVNDRHQRWLSEPWVGLVGLVVVVVG